MNTLQPCPRCSETNRAPTRYCPVCGWALRPGGPAATRRAGRAAPPKRSGAFAWAAGAWNVIEIVGWVAQIVVEIAVTLG